MHYQVLCIFLRWIASSTRGRSCHCGGGLGRGFCHGEKKQKHAGSTLHRTCVCERTLEAGQSVGIRNRRNRRRFLPPPRLASAARDAAAAARDAAAARSGGRKRCRRRKRRLLRRRPIPEFSPRCPSTIHKPPLIHYRGVYIFLRRIASSTWDRSRHCAGGMGRRFCQGSSRLFFMRGQQTMKTNSQ